jgi:hypothetical protein
MIYHGGRAFQRAAIFQVGRYAGVSKGGVANASINAGSSGMMASQQIGVWLGESSPAQLLDASRSRPEKGSLAVQVNASPTR